MEEEDRRALLRTLNDSEYKDVMNVCAVMPNIEMIIKSEGMHRYGNTVINLQSALGICLF